MRAACVACATFFLSTNNNAVVVKELDVQRRRLLGVGVELFWEPLEKCGPSLKCTPPRSSSLFDHYSSAAQGGGQEKAKGIAKRQG
jgi:hypothetical protein